MAEVSMDLVKIQNKISEKWKLGYESAKIGDLKPIYEYCRYVSGLYSEGYIGYLIFPYRMTGLFSLEEYWGSDTLLREIASLGADLELPDAHLDGGPGVRASKTKELQDLIGKLPK